MKRYVLRDEYKPGTDVQLRRARVVALRLVHELHETFPGGVVTEEQIYSKFNANIDELKIRNKQGADMWVRFLLRHSKEDGNWYREV